MDDLSDLIPRFDLRGMDLQLDRMHAALHELDHPCRTIPAIQVLGTNGKGSIVSFLESALCAAGLRCGVTTSPHLVSWCERIRIKGKPIAVETLRTQLQALQALNERHRLTPFELLVTTAFLEFQRHACDLLVLEVGLGGRLDATTAHPYRPVVAVASIGLDHCEHLGNSLTAIATEKAAAIPPQATVISCVQAPEVRDVLKTTCRTQQATLHWVKPLDSNWQLGLPGAIQRSNAAVALDALRALSGLGWTLPEAMIQKGFATAHWPGRLQTVHWGDQKLRLDGAHNPPAAVQLAEERNQWIDASNGVVWILAIQAHKDAVAMLQTLLLPQDQAWIIPVPSHKSWSRSALLQELPQLDHQLQEADGLETVLNQLSSNEWPTPVPIVAGSLYLIGDLFARGVVTAE
ncbi:dihydrofolate synthase [Synechococcus sp. MU1643]|uniref:bifunctional folylpolyglutamate synthase/dihydrofolate synthase n=1 Tax=Synechococcus sp. MU1643 TaxID=2508349 RepID=UPI001CF87181|nr:dihydrofolate synthase [Synechococcus sp. MU1643]